jgi:hypothetical protein
MRGSVSRERREAVSKVKRTKAAEGPFTASDGQGNSEVFVEKETTAAVGAPPITSRLGHCVDRAKARMGTVEGRHEAVIALVGHAPEDPQVVCKLSILLRRGASL